MLPRQVTLNEIPHRALPSRLQNRAAAPHPARGERHHVLNVGSTLWKLSVFVPKCHMTPFSMAKQISLKGHRYWILSEPEGFGWRAMVAEVKDDGSQESLGIEASAETRGAADDAAERKLRRLLQAY